MRSRISLAALLVKVTAKIESAPTPLWSNRAIRAVMTRVFPDPAPARTNNGPSPCSTAARCCELSRKAARSSPHRALVQGGSFLLTNTSTWRSLLKVIINII
jgi:hypothetical protein